LDSTACLNLLPPLTGWMPAAAVPLHARHGTWESSQGVRECTTASQHELYCMMRHPVAFYATLSAATSSFYLTIALSMRAPYWDQLILKCLPQPSTTQRMRARLLARGSRQVGMYRMHACALCQVLWLACRRACAMGRSGVPLCWQRVQQSFVLWLYLWPLEAAPL
jgi:hypothetical protein